MEVDRELLFMVGRRLEHISLFRESLSNAHNLVSLVGVTITTHVSAAMCSMQMSVLISNWEELALVG